MTHVTGEHARESPGHADRAVPLHEGDAMTTPHTHHDQTPWNGPFPGVPPVPSQRSVHPTPPAPWAGPFAPATPPAGLQAWPPPPPGAPPGPPPFGPAAGPAGPAGPARPPGGPRRRTARNVLLAVAVVVLGLVTLARLGQSDGTAAAPAPVPASTTAAPAPVTPAPTPKGPRPATGAVIVEQGRSGNGELTAVNGGSTDAYVTLASGQQVIRGFYVRAGETATISDVPDGTYDIYFATGEGWNEDLRGFTAARQATRYDDPFTFTTTSTQFTTWTVTLTPVVGGNAPSSDLSPDAVPR